MASFTIFMGVPEMEALWKDLTGKADREEIKGDDRQLLKLLVKAFALLSADPKYPGLHTHEIDALTKRYPKKVFQSYLENRTPAAGRLYWAYGPEKEQITVIGLEPHPDSSKSKGYAKVVLSTMPRL